MLFTCVAFVVIGGASAGFWDIFSGPEVVAPPLQVIPTAQPAPPTIWHIHKYQGINVRPVAPVGRPTDTWEPEVVHLARQHGLHESQLPPPSDVMALLGVSTQAEAIEAIREIAATPDGVAAVRNYLGSASQMAPQRVAPPTLSHIHHRTDIDAHQSVLTGERVEAVNALTSASVAINQ